MSRQTKTRTRGMSRQIKTRTCGMLRQTKTRTRGMSRQTKTRTLGMSRQTKTRTCGMSRQIKTRTCGMLRQKQGPVVCHDSQDKDPWYVTTAKRVVGAGGDDRPYYLYSKKQPRSMSFLTGSGAWAVKKFSSISASQCVLDAIYLFPGSKSVADLFA